MAMVKYISIEQRCSKTHLKIVPTQIWWINKNHDFINWEGFKFDFRGNATKYRQQQWRNEHDASQHANEHANEYAS